MLNEKLVLDVNDGQKLINTARRAIENYLNTKNKIDPPKSSKKLKERKGVFVTLKKPEAPSGRDLRGCMGIPLSKYPLIEAVITASINSATKDPRFRELELKELKNLVLEISVLSKPEEVEFKNDEDLKSKIKIGKNGLIIEGGKGSGLLLPTVPVEHNWDVEEFLDQTCLKAGLQGKCWKDPQVKIKKFTGVTFKEESPGGKVVQVSNK